MTVRVERFSDLTPWLDGLAHLRIAVFRDWPYLYEGSLDYERGYLRTYADSPGSVIVGAFDGDRLVGASTGLPLAAEPDYVTAPFRAAGEPVERAFYFGESVLRREYRGAGVGVRFFEEREAHARALGFQWAYFCGVVRPPDHPARPADFVPLDAFWRKRGYELTPLVSGFSWRDVGEAQESLKPMAYWRKRLG
jgi:GNAT superfamily N-acetyltransferase